MRYRLLGQSPGTYFLALLLREGSFDVEIHRKAPGRRLRPLRLDDKTFNDLRHFFAKWQRASSLFTETLEVLPYAHPRVGQSIVQRLRPWLPNPDRWLDGEALTGELEALVLKAGIRVVPFDAFNEPAVLDTDLRTVYDLDTDEMRALGAPFREGVSAKFRRIECLECWLPVGRINDRAQAPYFLKLEGSLVFLEAHPRGGFSVSLYSSSRYALDRALRALEHPKGSGPAQWRALFSMNRKTERLERSLQVRPSPYYLPGAFALGAGIGVFGPMTNRADLLGLGQARRLAEFLLFTTPQTHPDPYLLTETWLKRELREYHHESRKLRVWERLLGAERPRPMALSVAQLLPSVLRRFL